MAEKPRFQMRMIGEAVAPETVRASDLADFVSDLEAAISAATPEAEAIDQEQTQEAIVSLVGIERGSSNLTFAVSSAAFLSVRAISQAIATDDYRTLPPKTHERMHQISNQAIRKGWSLEFVEDEGSLISAAVISCDHPVPPPAPTVVTAPTTIWGELMRVGGAKPRAEIRLPNKELLYFDLTREMAKQLVDSLYEIVSIEGEGTWTLGDRSLIGFKATRVTHYRPERSSILDAFKELADLAKGRWDNVDAVEYVHSLRSEDKLEYQTEDRR